MDTPAAALGQIIRRLRAERGLTQKALAGTLGISQSALSAWESGDTLPPPAQLDRLASAFEIPPDELEAALSRAETDEASERLSVRRIHAQAAEHVRRLGPESLSIWVIGATNLSVMEDTFVQDRWKANLLRGIDYTVLWFLDLLSEESFRAALAMLGEIERRVRAEGGKSTGTITHYATNGFDPPTDLMLALYEELGKATASGDHKQTNCVHAYRSSLRADTAKLGEAGAALSEAVKKLLKCWHPETGIVFYRPKTMATPPAANIRLMPVTERIIEGWSRDAENSKYWLWLSPAGAARLNNAVTAFERAFGALEGRASGARQTTADPA